MFLADSTLEKLILIKLEQMIDWTVTRTVKVKRMKLTDNVVKVFYVDINDGTRYSMEVPI